MSELDQLIEDYYHDMEWLKRQQDKWLEPKKELKSVLKPSKRNKRGNKKRKRNGKATRT